MRTTEDRSQESEIRENFAIKGEVIDNLSRLKGMFVACRYLMGGRKRYLEGEEADFELCFADIRDRLDDAIEAIGEIR